LVVGGFGGAATVLHHRDLTVFVVFEFNGVGFPVGVADFFETVPGVVGDGGGASGRVGDLGEVPGEVVFLERFPSDRVNFFGDLLHHLVDSRNAPVPSKGAGASALQGQSERVRRLLEALMSAR
jgi:hypothetical protein